MPIKFTHSYQASDNTMHPTLHAAKVHEIKLCLAPEPGGQPAPQTFDALAERIVSDSEKVVEILSLKERARVHNEKPKPRKSRRGHAAQAPVLAA